MRTVQVPSFAQQFHTAPPMSLFSRSQTPAPNAPPPTDEQRRARLADLERVIGDKLDSFIKAGAALATIRDEQLYRLSHSTFADYVSDRWGITARRAYLLIAGNRAAEQLTAAASTPPEAITTTEKLQALPAEAQQQVRDTMNGRATTRKKKARRPKVIRLKVPGAIVTIERRSADVDTLAALRAAVDQITQRASERVAA